MDEQNIVHRYDYATASLRTLIFLFEGANVLLLKGASGKTRWADRYNGLGGHVTPVETIHAAALRELNEETGITSVALRLVGTVHINMGKPTTVCLFVFAAELTNRPQVIASPEGEPVWLPINDLPRDSLLEDLPLLIASARASLNTHELFHAHYSFDKVGHMSITITPSPE